MIGEQSAMTADDFNRELNEVISRYLAAGVCSGCLARMVFGAAISLAASDNGDTEICWPEHLPESRTLIEALVMNIMRMAEDHERGEAARTADDDDQGTAILPPGTSLQ